MNSVNDAAATQDVYGRYAQWLARLANDGAAMAVLRRSLAHEPGDFPPAFPYIEPLVPKDSHASKRQSLYLVAGLFSRSKKTASQSFATAFAKLFNATKGSDSVEKRFIACLSADEGQVAHLLRTAAALLASKELYFDHAQLARDTAILLNPNFDKERVRARWAQDFYASAAARK